jgi:hypothetical protein
MLARMGLTRHPVIKQGRLIVLLDGRLKGRGCPVSFRRVFNTVIPEGRLSRTIRDPMRQDPVSAQQHFMPQRARDDANHKGLRKLSRCTEVRILPTPRRFGCFARAGDAARAA